MTPDSSTTTTTQSSPTIDVSQYTAPKGGGKIDANAFKAAKAPKAAKGAGQIDAAAFKSTAAPKAQKGGLGRQVVKAVSADLRGSLDRITATAHGYLEDLRQRIGDKTPPEGPIADAMKGWGALLDVIGVVGSPAQAALDTMGDQFEGLVQDFGHLVQKGAAPDVYDPQARREGQQGQQYPKGVDWKIHAADVQRVVETTQSLVKPALYAAATVLPTGKTGERPLTPKPGEPSPKPGEPPPGEPPEQVIQPKPRMQVVGQTPEGKPRVRLMQPDQARAGVAEATAEMHPVRTKPSTEQEALIRMYGEWFQPHNALEKIYQAAYENKQPIGAHALLDSMIPASKGYVQTFLQKLREHVDDVPVRFTDQIHDYNGKPAPNDWAGLYRHRAHDVQIRWITQFETDAKFPPLRRTTNVAHELVHAATSQFIAAHPTHPIVQELERLRRIAGQHLSGEEHYGLENVHEFVAEALSDSIFQRALTKIKARTGGGTVWSRLADKIRELLGIENPHETDLLNRTLALSERLMEKQKEDTGLYDFQPAAVSPVKAREVTAKMASLIEQSIRAINPEGLGQKAKLSAATIASRVAERIQRTNVWHLGSEKRLRYWEANEHLVGSFLSKFEAGEKFTGPLAAMAEKYREWAGNIYRRDTLITGLQYEPEENYLPRLFEQPESVRAYLSDKFGKSWGTPGFIKDRSEKTITELLAAGYKLKYRNPEEMMLARQLASDIAAMRTGILKDMAEYGLAFKKGKGAAVPAGYSLQRSPTGEWYAVHNQAFAPLKNAFDSYSLWQDPSGIGSVFRGGMDLKNRIVPVRLSMSLFHVLHVMHIDNAATIERALGPGSGNVFQRAGQIISALPGPNIYNSFIKNPLIGAHYVRVFDDAIAANKLTENDEFTLQLMIEGGYIPKMDAAYRAGAEKTMGEAWSPVFKGQVWKLPSALLTSLRRPIFEIWIPNLKTASYIKTAQAQLKADPTLLDDAARRKLALRRTQKSVDNRYGEMSYNNLFWTRWAKDLMVLNTLSLGWVLGFFREFGGGAMDVGQFAYSALRGDAVKAIREDKLRRPLFGTAYLTTAAGYGGLMTYFMSGHHPHGWMDYVYPRTGNTNPDGTPERVNTMFYTREIASIFKRIQNQGVIQGAEHFVESKSAGVIGLVSEFFSGIAGSRPVDNFDKEFADPNAPLLKRTEQTLAHMFSEVMPISVQNFPGKTVGEKFAGATKHPGPALRSIAGFTPAPKYITDTKTDAMIKDFFHLYVAPRQTPYDQVEQSKEYTELRQMYKTGDPKYDDKLSVIMSKYKLNEKDLRRLHKSFNSNLTPNQRMFMRLRPEQQRQVLRAAPPKERDIYLPHANKKVKGEFE